jgi:hypothetical protein
MNAPSGAQFRAKRGTINYGNSGDYGNYGNYGNPLDPGWDYTEK